MAFDASNSFIAEDIRFPQEELRPSHWVRTGFVATRRVKVDWEDRYAWALWFCDNADHYPYFTSSGITNSAYITSVGVEPDHESQLTHGPEAYSQAKYIYAYLTLHYQAAGISNRTILIESIEPREETIPVPQQRGQFFFNDNTPATITAIHAPGLTLVIDYPRLSVVPNAALLLPGYVNSDVFVPRLFPTMFFGRGTLLDATPSVEASLHFDGSLRYHLRHYLHWRPVDWNKEMNTASGQMEYAYDANGNPLIKYGYTQFTGHL